MFYHESPSPALSQYFPSFNGGSSDATHEHGEGTLYNCQYTTSRILFGLSVTSNVLDRRCSASLRESSLWCFKHWRYRAGLLLWPSLAYPDGYMAPFYIFLYVRKEICWDSVQLHQRDGHLFFLHISVLVDFYQSFV